MIEIKLFEKVGGFAEDKDIARKIRIRELMPALARWKKVILNFENITGATQSFVHALISAAMRKHGIEFLDKVVFKSCTASAKSIVKIVVEYMQNGVDITDNDSNL